MCNIAQALRVADSIAATHPLPDDTVVVASKSGVAIQGTFTDPAAFAARIELHEKASSANGYQEWLGAYQNVPVSLAHFTAAAEIVAAVEQEVAS